MIFEGKTYWCSRCGSFSVNITGLVVGGNLWSCCDQCGIEFTAVCDTLIKNLTPHNLTVFCLEDVEKIADHNPRTGWTVHKGEKLPEPLINLPGLPKGGNIPGAEVINLQLEPLLGVPRTEKSFGKTINLPDVEEETYLFVSSITATAGRLEGRKDLLTPGVAVRIAGAEFPCGIVSFG